MGGFVEVVVGRVGRAHGLRGEVTIGPRTDEPELRFAPGAVVRIEGTRRLLHVRTAQHASGGLRVGFREVSDRDGAERLHGALLVADVEADTRPDGEEAYYDRQLRGLKVLDAAGLAVGTVSDVLHLPAQDLLSVDVAGTERLVPFVAALVPGVDLEAGTLTLADVGGLVDDDAEEAR